MKPTTALLLAGVLAPGSYVLGRDLLSTLRTVDEAPYAQAAAEARQAGADRRAPQLGSEFLIDTTPSRRNMNIKQAALSAAGMAKEAGGMGAGRATGALAGAASSITDDLGRALGSFFSRSKVQPNMAERAAMNAANEAYDLHKLQIDRAVMENEARLRAMSDAARNLQGGERSLAKAELEAARQQGLAHINGLNLQLNDLDANRVRARSALEAATAANPDPTYVDSKHRLLAAGIGGAGLLGGAAALDALTDSGYTDALGYELNKKMTPLSSRIRLDETVAQSYAQQLSKNVANMTANMIAQTGGALAAAPGAVTRMNMAQNLLDSDEILRNATPQQRDVATRAYESMSRIAPDIAADPSAAANFMREAVVTGNGPDYATVGSLAQAQKNIIGNPITWTKGIPGAGGV